MEKDCKICDLKITFIDANSYVVLTEKVFNEINNAKKRRGEGWTISAGERVHIDRRARYVNSETIEQDLKQKKLNSDEGQPSSKKLHSSSSFECKTCFFYCSEAITEREFRDRRAKLCLRTGNLTRRF